MADNNTARRIAAARRLAAHLEMLGQQGELPPAASVADREHLQTAVADIMNAAYHLRQITGVEGE